MKLRCFSTLGVRGRPVVCRPHCEILEARLPLGDVLLGTVWASSLVGASLTGGKHDLVDSGLPVLVCEEMALTSVEGNSSFGPKVASRTARIERVEMVEASRDLAPAEFVAAPNLATAPVRAIRALPVWHAFAASSSGLTAPEQGGAKAWHPAVARPEPAPSPPTGSQALPGNRLPQSSASNARGGASGAVRSQAEPGNEVGEAAERYGNMPLAFEANYGQTDSRVDFITRTGGATVFLTPTSAVFSIQGRPPSEPEALATSEHRASVAHASGSERSIGAAVHMQIVGANPNATPIGQQQQPGIVNYFIGDNPDQWHANIPTFGRVEYQDVYPGIDLAYYGAQPSAFSDQSSESNGPPTTDYGPSLEYDFIVSPGADPNAIALNFAGADELEINPEGDLIIHTAAGDLVQQKPYLYQEVNGTRQEVAGEFRIQNSESSGSTDHCLLTTDYCSVTFDVGAYDASRPLVIDPLVLGYSTYLGGGGESDSAYDVAVDRNGNAYVSGDTDSTKFPTTDGAFDSGYNGNNDGFVAKLNEHGTGLVYATFLGGDEFDGPRGLALDTEGNIYVTGGTLSTDFPTTVGAFDTAYNGGSDVFVVKLTANGGTLAYGTYLGGLGSDSTSDIAVDLAGSAYVTGVTTSTDFPVTAGTFDVTFNRGLFDAYVAKVDPDGSALSYATYLGGSNVDRGHGIAVDAVGNAYVTGSTDSTDFPATPGAFDETYNSNSDTYVAMLSADGSALGYSTYLGGNQGDGPDDIAVDPDGNAYIAGSTQSVNFPVTPGAYDTIHLISDGSDGFLTKLNNIGSALIYSTFLSAGSSSASAISLDDTGSGYVTGISDGGLPTTSDAFDKTYNGGGDSYLMKLNQVGSALVYSTYLGGANSDLAWGLALDSASNAYTVGRTYSSDFPTTPGALKRRNRAGTADGFVTKFSEI